MAPDPDRHKTDLPISIFIKKNVNFSHKTKDGKGIITILHVFVFTLSHLRIFLTFSRVEFHGGRLIIGYILLLWDFTFLWKAYALCTVKAITFLQFYLVPGASDYHTRRVQRWRQHRSRELSRRRQDARRVNLHCR